MRQKDDKEIGASACGPTSVAMLLRYYFQNSNINLQEVYHSGTQLITYDGPASSYLNVSFQKPNTGLDRVAKDAREFYRGTYSGMDVNNMRRYLDRTWGVVLGEPLTINGVYREIVNGPLLGRVYGHGNIGWGHFVVIRGIDEKGTPTDRTDDVIYINDPNDIWESWDTSGNNKAIAYNIFFSAPKANVCAACTSAWFREAYTFSPTEQSMGERNHVIVVDTGHNGIEGNVSAHRLDLDNPSLWKLKVQSGGDFYTPNNGETNRAARWTPRIALSGFYEVSVRYKADPLSSRAVNYTVYTPSSSTTVPQANVLIDQYAVSETWRSSIISRSVYLAAGSYIRATGIAAGTNIDAVKLRRIPQ